MPLGKNYPMSTHLSSDEYTEAQRIAGELVRLHNAGLFTAEEFPMVATVARALRIFGGTVDFENLSPMPRRSPPGR